MVDSRLIDPFRNCRGRPGHDCVVIEQFVQEVRDFSSQYGSDISISYTAYNIAGKPSKFPDYGDFPQAFVMRTYGSWWEEAPSRREPIMPQNFREIPSQDYVDIQFEQFVYPYGVSIYETYNPGSVVRIWAKVGDEGIDVRWELLWEGEPQTIGHTPRIFSPSIRTINKRTCLLKLEFDHSKLEYYTELDAVMLIGTRQPIECKRPDQICDILDHEQDHEDALNADSIRSQSYCPKCIFPELTLPSMPSYLERNQQFRTGIVSSSALSITAPISDLTERIIKLNIRAVALESDSSLNSCLVDSSAEDSDESSSSISIQPSESNNGAFSVLPEETILYIFSQLDLVSLLRCSKVNRYFNKLSKDSHLYSELNLKPYWPWMNANSFTSLLSRCNHLTKLDLSWCGNYKRILSADLTKVIKELGHKLEVLRLDNCRYVDSQCMKQVTITCRNLRELTLRNNSTISTEGYMCLKDLEYLERLDFYRTKIETQSLIEILMASPNLKHVNLGSCVNISSMDEVAFVLGAHNMELRTVDFWKTYSLTPAGVRALNKCTKLEEIDFGWCLGLCIPGDSMSILARSCPKLKKIFLGALRGLQDRDLLPFIKYCPLIEQLDLLGVRAISPDICYQFLKSFKNLRLLDLSFCAQLPEADVISWREEFPNVSIKRSFQYEDGRWSNTYLPNHY